jgi:hypothetical protein
MKMSKRTLVIVILAVISVLLLGMLNFHLAAYDAKDLQRLLKTNRCQGGDLRNADLCGKNLAHAKLQTANLQGANLTNTNLTDAYLNHAILNNAVLTGAILKKANLEHAKLQNANLDGADLSRAELRFADLRQASLVNADLRGTDLNFANLLFADLTGASLEGAILKHAILPRATPTPTRISGPTPTRRIGPTVTRRVTYPPPPTQPIYYTVLYAIQTDWGTGATINVTITNKTTVAVNGWVLAWNFPDNQIITSLWNGTYTQNGASVSVKDAGFNASIAANGGSTSFGFNLNYSVYNGKPTYFTLNGRTCSTGGGSPTPTPIPSPRPTPRPTPTMGVGQGLVSGAVLDANSGAGLNGAQVDVYKGVNYTNYVTSTTCDHLGIYTLSLDPGEYLLVVRMSNYLPINIHIQATQGIITYEPQTGAIPLNYQGIGNVSGTITDAVNGQPLSGVQISFREGVNSRVGPIVSSVVTNSGAYLLSLPAGNYTGEITGAGYITGYLNVVTVGGRITTPPGYSVSPVAPDDQIRIVLNWGIKSGAMSAYINGYNKNDESLNSYPNIYWDRSNVDTKGPITVSLFNKSQLKNFIYTVHDCANSSKYNSWNLLASQAVVRVYEGSKLTATFPVPMTQTGNHWTVFYFDQNGIVPINQFCDQSDPYKMQAHDFDGGERLDWVGKGANQLTVFHWDGTQHTYPINAPYWDIFAYQDTNGEPGEEMIIVISRNFSDLYYGRGERYLIIHDRDQSVRELANFGNTAEVSFLRLEELDGEPGMELVLEKTVSDPYQYILRIISGRTNFYRDYDFSNSTPHFNYQSAIELNGVPGNEIILTQNDWNGHTQLATLNFRDDRLNYYSFDSDYSSIIPGELDGEPGSEIILIPDCGSPNDGINIIHDRTQTVRKYPDYDSATHTFYFGDVDLDGVPGCELICEITKDSPYQHIIRIISDRANSYRDFDFSSYGPEFFINGYFADLNGRPGNELLGFESPITGGRMAVLSYLDNTIHDYTIEYNSYWRIIDYLDVDGAPGVELVIEADGSPEGAADKKILIIQDSTRSVRQFSGFGSGDTGFYLAAMIDLDGEPGLELIFDRTINDPYDYTVRILSQRLNSYRDYDFSQPGEYVSLYFPLLGDLDGQPGSELVLLKVGENYELDVLSYRNDRVHRYGIEPSWDIMGVYEFDGQPGMEIISKDYISLRVISEAQGVFIQ